MAAASMHSINPNGAKWWRFDYTFTGKRKTLSVGVYPANGLADARRKSEEAAPMSQITKTPATPEKKQKPFNK